jgi:molybdopterin-containing oxidoreductase family iron-sulfur binding subunit
MNRRDFLKTIGASSATAIAVACDRPPSRLVSQMAPADVLPGNPKFVRTTCTECPAGCGLVATIRDGHPVKLEGEPALCMRGQASLSRLYHPDRLRAPTLRGQKITWDEAFAVIKSVLGKPGPHAFLSSRTTGELRALIDGFCQQNNVERLPEFETYPYAAIRQANLEVFGKDVIPFYDVAKADLLITVGVDVLETFANPVQFARDLAAAKLHWIHAEPHLSLTGINADERIVIPASSEAEFLASEKVVAALKNAKHPLIIANGAGALPAAKLQKAHNSPVDFSRGLDYSSVGTVADAEELKDRTFGVLFVHQTTTAAKANFRIGIGDFEMKDCDLVLPVSHALEDAGALKPLGDTLPATKILQKLGATPGKWAVLLGKISWEPATVSGPVLTIVPSVRTFDGRSAVLPLLSEIPDPLTTITYGGWVTISEQDAAKLGVQDRGVVEIKTAAQTLSLPARVMPGQPAGVFTVQRPFVKALPVTECGDEATVLPIVSVAAGNRSELIPILSGSMSAAGRGILPEQEKAHHHGGPTEDTTLYPPHEHKHYRWGMAIDLDRCTGCGACVAACYVENNIPVVGPAEHNAGREMSWLRLEPYVQEDGGLELLPMMCQHCDHAPCEPVCPVVATYHTVEGLNGQVYNRCVGTRYCANNCPFKVRRFNWQENKLATPLDMMLNPDVSKRPAGVMEKCTFCVHRITKAKDHAKDEGRLVRDGEFTTACAQTCPAEAIVFGNIMDEHARVTEWSQDGRAYRVLEDLGTRPAVYYLKKQAGESRLKTAPTTTGLPTTAGGHEH